MDERKDSLLFANDFPAGSVLRDYTDPETGLRYLVVRGPLAFCAYVGVPKGHHLEGVDNPPLGRSHNFSTPGKPESVWPENWFWWGWDYGHAGSALEIECILDESGLPQEAQAHLLALSDRAGRIGDRPPKRWTLGEVELDALDALLELKRARFFGVRGRRRG